MSVRLFIGYFLVLAACATLAFAPSQADSSTPFASADAGIAPEISPSAFAASFHTHPHRITTKRPQIAEAE